MSVILKEVLKSVALTGIATPALAAGDARTPPEDLVVWIFLGFCALIIIAQVAPLIRLGKKGSEQVDKEQAAEQSKTH